MNPEWEDGKAESLALAPDPVRRDRSAAPRASLAQDATPAPMPDNLFALALCNLPHGVCMFDETRHLILCNPAYARLYQLPERLTRPARRCSRSSISAERPAARRPT